MDQSNFANKFISRLERIDPPQIESFLTQLVKEKDFQRAVFDSIQEAILVVDGELRLAFANEAARTLLGVDPRKAVGSRLGDIFKPRALKALAQEYLEHPQARTNVEARAGSPPDRVFTVSIVPLDGGEGRHSHSVWIIGDRTSEYERIAEKRQFESIQSLATLTAGIAHEIKNPLNSLNIHAQLIERSAAELAERGIGEEEAMRLEKSTGVLLEEIARLTRIVDQFIKAARPPKLALRKGDLNSVVDDVAQLIGPECERRHIELEVDLDPLVPALEFDPEQIKQAILNLAKNAMEAIDKPEGRVSLRTCVAQDGVLVEIEDNGSGIPEEDRLRVFEPYHTTKFDGSGLGLMVVFRIVKAHRGVIGLDSAIGRGTVFRVALPLAEMPVRLLESEGQSIVDLENDPAGKEPR